MDQVCSIIHCVGKPTFVSQKHGVAFCDKACEQHYQHCEDSWPASGRPQALAVEAPKRTFDGGDDGGDDAGGSAASSSSSSSSTVENRRRLHAKMAEYADALAKCVRVLYLLDKVQTNDDERALMRAQQYSLSVGSVLSDATNAAGRVNVLIAELATALSNMAQGLAYNDIDVFKGMREARDIIAGGKTLRDFDEITNNAALNEGVPDDIRRMMALQSNAVQKVAEKPVEVDVEVTFFQFSWRPRDATDSGGGGQELLMFYDVAKQKRFFYNTALDVSSTGGHVDDFHMRTDIHTFGGTWVKHNRRNEDFERWDLTTTAVTYTTNGGTTLTYVVDTVDPNADQMFAKTSDNFLCVFTKSHTDADWTVNVFEARNGVIVHTLFVLPQSELTKATAAIDSDGNVWTVVHNGRTPPRADVRDRRGNRLGFLWLYLNSASDKVGIESADREGVWIAKFEVRKVYSSWHNVLYNLTRARVAS